MNKGIHINTSVNSAVVYCETITDNGYVGNNRTLGGVHWITILWSIVLCFNKETVIAFGILMREKIEQKQLMAISELFPILQTLFLRDSKQSPLYR